VGLILYKSLVGLKNGVAVTIILAKKCGEMLLAQMRYLLFLDLIRMILRLLFYGIEIPKQIPNQEIEFEGPQIFRINQIRRLGPDLKPDWPQ